jgi:predicted membrane GTPase involved in stress response
LRKSPSLVLLNRAASLQRTRSVVEVGEDILIMSLFPDYHVCETICSVQMTYGLDARDMTKSAVRTIGTENSPLLGDTLRLTDTVRANGVQNC